MQGVKFNVDQNGKIISYTTETGGADTVFPFSDTSDATATAAHITVGQTAYVNGVKITGTRPAPVTRQSGTVQINSVTGGTTKQHIVNFSTPFDKVPTVTAVVKKAVYSNGQDHTDKASVTVSNVTQSSCVLKTTHTFGSYAFDHTIDWTAQA